jgi:flagellar hook protein FlgE
MFSSIYTGLTGLLSFSRGLDSLSNNVGNMNTPGFKSSELIFRDLLYHYGLSNGEQGGFRMSLGQGVTADVSTYRFRLGETKDTGNALDVAIDGNGFFILSRDREMLYTRNGQFEFGEDGYLVEKATGARVASFQGSGQLGNINIAEYRTSPPTATSQITFVGNLSRGGTTHPVNNVTVFDAVGGSHALNLTFTNNNAVVSGSWLVEIRDSANAMVANGEIRFQGNGSPAVGFNNMTFTFSPAGAPASNITLFFGDPGSFSGATNFSGGTTSDMRVDTQNGRAAGSLTETTFDERGYLTLKYSNGETVQGPRLALAWFDDLQRLTQLDGARFRAEGNQQVRIEAPGEGIMGSIVPKSVELSNVELTEEFTNMVIIQRGYQASSQVITVANEMLQQLLDMRSRR